MTDHERPSVMAETHSASHCPSCGRFVGPYGRCPYCGADVGQRIAIRTVKYGSLVLAVIGVAVLLWAATLSQVPVVEIGRLSGTMNWAYVRIEGIVTRQPAYDSQAGTLTLWVGDGTGQILVMAYQSEAEWLLDENLVPAMGDGLALEGTLRIKDDFQYLVLNVPQHTEVRPAVPAELPIAEVSAAELYQKVTVRGVIRDDRSPYEGLRILSLRDASGQIDLALYGQTDSLAGPWPELRVGQTLQATGAVDQYSGRPQVSVGRATDLVVLDQALAIAPELRLGQLSAAGLGDLAAVEGTIVQVDRFSAGVKCTLDDGTGTATLLLWQDLYEGLADRYDLVEGARLRALGEVVEYQGELEIVPQLPSDVTLLAVAELAVPERRLGDLAAGDRGQRVQVEGVLRSLQTFSAGVKGILDDGTGTVTLLLWQDVYDALSDLVPLRPGALLRAKGQVDEYQGELEIVPQAPADVAVLGLLDLPLDEQARLLPTSTPLPSPSTPSPTSSPTSLPSSPVPLSPTSPPPSPIPPSPTSPPSFPPSPTPPPTPPPPPTRLIGAITAEDEGAVFTVAQAGIEAVDYFSKGVRFTLSDSTGRIILLLWQNILEEIPGRHDLFPGSQVRVTGQIEQYQGDLEIVPHNGEGVAVLARGQRGAVEQRRVSDIGAADEGRFFVVEGRVTRVEGAGWLRVWLGDGTGEILIFLPERLGPYLPTGIGPGVRLRVTGEVDIYKSQVEIIPLAGADVEVQ